MSIAQAVGPRPHHVIALPSSSGSGNPLLYRERRIAPDRRGPDPLPSGVPVVSAQLKWCRTMSCAAPAAWDEAIAGGA